MSAVANYKPIQVRDEKQADEVAEIIKAFVRDFQVVNVDLLAGHQEKSSHPMKGTWRMWMKETADWMAAQGAKMPLWYRPNGEPVGKRKFNKDDAHEAFMSVWGGVDAAGDRHHQEHVDRGTMLHIMDKHLAWATEKGITLTIPRDGEYMKLKNEGS